MNGKDACKQVIEFSFMVARSYVDDLSDADLLVRSVPGSNHIAWQLGHLTFASHHFLQALGQPGLNLPAGFAEAYSKETSGSDDPARFAKKADYVAWMDQAKAASLAAVDAIPDAQFDVPGPESMRAYAPTVGSIVMLMGTHWLMHAGQFVPIRRKLGKPPLF